MSPAARHIWEGFARDHVTHAADMWVSLHTGHTVCLLATMFHYHNFQLPANVS